MKFVGGMLFVIVGAGAGYVWYTLSQARGRADRAELTAQQRGDDLAACKKDREAERGTRESAEKTAAETSASLNASRAELDELRAEHAEAEKRLAAFKTLTEKFRKMIDSGKLQVIIRHGRMIVKLPAGILFASGSADLSKDGQSALGEVAGILKQFPDRRFMVAGHTDNVPVTPPSTFKNNLELSTARALTVASQLISAGMHASHLVAAGYAEFEPVRENTTEAGRQENRRIEIVLLPNIAELPPMPTAATAAAPAPPAPSASASAH
jgi:chemotaxis protein MotB